MHFKCMYLLYTNYTLVKMFGKNISKFQWMFNSFAILEKIYKSVACDSTLSSSPLSSKGVEQGRKGPKLVQNTSLSKDLKSHTLYLHKRKRLWFQPFFGALALRKCAHYQIILAPIFHCGHQVTGSLEKLKQRLFCN